MPIKSGPAAPFCARVSATAWHIARICVSLNEFFNDEPLCPEVPNETIVRGSSGEGASV
jgi:hypothetical protein